MTKHHFISFLYQAAIARLERQYEEDKQSALEKQRQEYEKHFQQLKSFMSPSTPYPPYAPFDPFRTGITTIKANVCHQFSNSKLLLFF